jgi:hypothetical protein
MAKKEDIFLTVTYPFKEYDNEVDEFISDSFKLFGINSTGSGTDFNSRDVNGHCTDESNVIALETYLSTFPFQFVVSWYLTKKEN